MSRREKIESLFEDKFIKYRNENIVIFGTGQYAEWIVTNFSAFNIVGVLDRWLSYGKWLGKPIFSYKEIIDKQVKVIIIAANIYNTETIRKRIEGFCNDNSIKLFSLEGELLNEPLEGGLEEIDSKYYKSLDKDFNTIGFSRFRDCKEALTTDIDKAYWELIECKFFGTQDCVDKLGRLYIKNSYDIGYLFLGPLVTDLMLWLLEQIKNRKSEKIIFSARDGYLLHKLYLHLVEKGCFGKLPESSYLLTSRYVCMLSGLYNETDIRECAKTNFAGDARLMLKQRFLLNKDEIVDKADDSTIDYILLHKDIILEKAKVIRENYINYLSVNGIGRDKNTLFFDLVASGTCQNVIEKLTDTKLIGTYMLQMPSKDENKKKLNIIPYHEFDEEFATHSMFIESILTSFQSTLLFVDADLEPVFAKETRNIKELQFIKDVQTGIFDYFTIFIDNNVNKLHQYSSSKIPDMIFGHVTSHYTKIENKIFEEYIVKDEIFNEHNSIANKCMV